MSLMSEHWSHSSHDYIFQLLHHILAVYFVSFQGTGAVLIE